VDTVGHRDATQKAIELSVITTVLRMVRIELCRGLVEVISLLPDVETRLWRLRKARGSLDFTLSFKSTLHDNSISQARRSCISPRTMHAMK
jgi:hypothetical protein